MKQHRLKVPSFDLNWMTVKGLDNESAGVLLIPGGGGSTKSGVKNQIQLISDDFNSAITFFDSFETDDDNTNQLCSGICSGLINVMLTNYSKILNSFNAMFLLIPRIVLLP